MRIVGKTVDTSGLGPNTNFRIFNGKLQFYDITANEWIEIWFDAGQLQIGGGITP